ncbi:MAG: hypothetical protein JW839_02175 [Candidatus Lokiarchaeota archaeon]|nr:hypothetical protein [Candidatus Lokiarchaeota archaeon]
MSEEEKKEGDKPEEAAEREPEAPKDEPEEEAEESEEPVEKQSRSKGKQKPATDAELEEKHIQLLRAQLPADVLKALDKKLGLSTKTNKQQIAALEEAFEIHAAIQQKSGKGADPGSNNQGYPRIPKGAEATSDDLLDAAFNEPDWKRRDQFHAENLIKPLHSEGNWNQQGDEVDLEQYEFLLKHGPTKARQRQKNGRI